MLLGTSADIWLYAVSLGLGLLLSLPSAIGRSGHRVPGGHHAAAPRAGHQPGGHHAAGHQAGGQPPATAQGAPAAPKIAGSPAAGTHQSPRPTASHQAQSAHGHSDGTHASHALPRYALLNPIAFSAFLGGFGATGLIARGAGSTLLLGLIFALGCGLLLSFLIFNLFVRYVLAAEGGSAPDREAAVGKIAVVTVAIPASGMGSVAYVINGRRQTIAARTGDDSTLPAGSEVVVLDIDRNVVTVRPFKIVNDQ